MGFFDILKKITSSLFSGFTEADEAFFEELEETLILADLGMDTALDAVEKLRTRVRKEKLQDQEAVKAADGLTAEGVSVRVIDMHTLPHITALSLVERHLISPEFSKREEGSVLCPPPQRGS